MENREEILYKHIEWIFASDKDKESFLNAMSEYSDQQNKAILEEIEELKSELKAAESGNEVFSKSKLEILNEVKFSFEIHSDFSSQCNGYKYLCKQIEHLTSLKQA